MGVALYKPGQGYWVRVMTAVGAGIITLATAAWLWKQVELVPLPTTAWNVSLTAVTQTGAAPKAGDEVDLLESEAEGAQARVIGHARVKEFTPRSDNGGQLVLTDANMNEKFDPTAAKRVVAPAGGEAAPAFNAAVRGIQGVKIVELLYVQAMVAGVVILIGSILTYWLVGIKPPTADFMIATDAEMKKVNWSTKREVYGSTMVVIGASVLMATFLFLSDTLFSQFFRAIGVLQK
jgi:preprotein translocase SecE subunit